MVACLDKDAVACFDEGVVVCLYEGLVAVLDKNNKDDFYVDRRHSLDLFFEGFILSHILS